MRAGSFKRLLGRSFGDETPLAIGEYCDDDTADDAREVARTVSPGVGEEPCLGGYRNYRRPAARQPHVSSPREKVANQAG